MTTSGNKWTPQEAVDYRYRGQTFVFFPSPGDDAMKQWSDIMHGDIGHGGLSGGWGQGDHVTWARPSSVSGPGLIPES